MTDRITQSPSSHVPPLPPNHVAILHRRYAAMLLEGRKTIESRLGPNRAAPFGCVTVGQTIYFKPPGIVTSASDVVVANVEKVEYHQNLTPEKVRQLAEQYNDRIQGDPAYWNRKARSRFATMIYLNQIRRLNDLSLMPNLPRSFGHAWYRM